VARNIYQARQGHTQLICGFRLLAGDGQIVANGKMGKFVLTIWTHLRMELFQQSDWSELCNGNTYRIPRGFSLRP
jgi:hypothetical protein